MKHQDRSEFLEAAKAEAWSEPQECDKCGGSGVLEGTTARQIIHSMLGSFGADWDLEDVVHAIENADSVTWVDHWLGHNLKVVFDEHKTYYLDVSPPEADDETIRSVEQHG